MTNDRPSRNASVTLRSTYFTPTVNETDTLRPAISVRMSAAAGTLEAVDAGVTAVIAWLSIRLLIARRIRDSENLEAPRTV